MEIISSFVTFLCCILSKAFSSLQYWILALSRFPWMALHYNTLHDCLNKLVQQTPNRTFRAWSPWMDMIITTHAGNIEYVVKTNSANFIKGETFKQALADFLGESSLVLNDGLLFKELYGMALAGISSSSVKESEQTQTQQYTATKLLDYFRTMENRVVDLNHLLRVPVFEMMCKVGLGVEPQCVQGLDSFVKEFETASELSVLRIALPMFVWKFLRFVGVGYERRLRDSVGVMDQWLHSALEWRKDNAGIMEGVPSHILAAAMPQEEHLRNLSLNLLVAAMDSATALSWFFWCVCKHPHVEQKILEELLSIVSRRPANERGRKSFNKEEVKEMHYLHAALTEASRLYPAIPLSLVESNEAGVLPDGTAIRKGTSILVPIYAYGRSEDLWGRDAEEFKPDRWIRDGMFVAESELKFMTFHAGQRRCLGKQFAYNMMKSVAASLLLEYNICALGCPPVVPKVSMALAMKYGLHVIIQKRNGLIFSL